MQLHSVKGAGGWVVNNGTAAHPMVVRSSGNLWVDNADAWMAADGDTAFKMAGSKAQGWVSCTPAAKETPCTYTPLPGPQPPAVGPDVVKQWLWDGVNGNNAVWTGSSAGGIRLFPKGPEDEWQAAVPFDSRATPPLPTVWSNIGAGGITLYKNGSVVAFTGPIDVSSSSSSNAKSSAAGRSRAAGAGAGAGAGGSPAPIVLQFSMLVTPVRPVDLKKHYSERYAQLGGPSNYTYLAEQGATIVNMHQGNAINPWINYPYETNTLMKAAADACHALGLKFKIYNTMRELSNRAREVFAMRSLNETYVVSTAQGDTHDTVLGNGADWIQEHLATSYEPAWSNPVVNQYPGSAETSHLPPLTTWVDHANEQDAAIKVKALSRWNNYYVEGIRQMIDDFGYDGM